MRQTFRLFSHAIFTLAFGIGAVLSTAIPVHAQNFTGPYLGATVGMAHYNTKISGDDSTIRGRAADGPNFGVVLGIGNTAGNVYYGVEGNFGLHSGDFSKRNGNGKIEMDVEETYGASASLGFIMGDWMPYGLVGWQRVRLDVLATGPMASVSKDKTFDGFRAGAGLEYQGYGPVFFRGEYNYIGYRSEDVVMEGEKRRFKPRAGIFQFVTGVRF